MTGSQIVEAVTNSTLSDEEVQLVMEKLLEKQDEEWEAVSLFYNYCLCLHVL